MIKVDCFRFKKKINCPYFICKYHIVCFDLHQTYIRKAFMLWIHGWTFEKFGAVFYETYFITYYEYFIIRSWSLFYQIERTKPPDNQDFSPNWSHICDIVQVIWSRVCNWLMANCPNSIFWLWLLLWQRHCLV